MQLATLHLQLAPVLAAEKSKVPFYIVGGLLVVWAFVLSVGIGMRKPDFPGSLRAQRGVIGVTVALVIATLAAAILTSSSPSTHAKIQKTARQEVQNAAIPSQPAVTSASSTTSTTTTTTSEPEAAPAATEGGHKLALEANPKGLLAFSTKTLTATAGKETIVFTNKAPLEHDVVIAEGTKVLGKTPVFTGGSRTLTVTLKAGKYVYYCSVPGHRQAGMEGTLTVSAASSSSASSTTQTTTNKKPAAPGAASEGAHKLALEANPRGLLAFSTKTLTAKAGKETIVFTNKAPLEHDVVIAEGTKVLGKTPVFTGGSRTLTVTLKAGKYVYYCSVPGHRQAGMEGTLTVSP